MTLIQKNRKTRNLADWQKDSYFASGNEAYLEELYESFLNDPTSVSSEWQNYFNDLITKAPKEKPDVPHAAIREEFLALARHTADTSATQGVSDQQASQQILLSELINAYRRVGHLQADIDPLHLHKGIYEPTLELSYYTFADADMKKVFDTRTFSALSKPQATLTEIYQRLRMVYCGSIGFEYMHINRAEEIEWIRERIENRYTHFSPSREEKLRILDELIAADGIEKYLGFKYVGQKRFSLEGGDALIPLLNTMIQRSAELGVKETVIGMPHRGRLNVLVNVVGKNPKAIFDGFEGKGISTKHSGDVKYHLGYSSNLATPFGAMHVALAFNPSHLEIVSPVVQGSTRARQRRRRDTPFKQVMPIQMHGDAAFAGQGVVMETFALSQARWFTVGGSVHVVVNNQVGFTTSAMEEARSSLYCTDVAKMVEPPILHVNGNDVEAVYFAALFAIDFRQAFKKDVVIDLVCYRRHGHNEADEPSATQPVMYKVIKAMPVPAQLYAQKLIAEGVITADEVKAKIEKYHQAMVDGQTVVKLSDAPYEFLANWKPFVDQEWTAEAVTAVPMELLKNLAKELAKLPDGFVVQPQVKRVLEMQQKMGEGEAPLNWGYAETMAYASLLTEGYPIRLCGQDCARGTFAHRHAVLHDQNTDDTYIPLSHLSQNQSQINIVNSVLSEEAVLAFEYGYATTEPNFLVLWEAQFGDFANGAQVVIDQFLSSGEQKWARLCGLVMLLPHGYEGQGPEHSSARLERYLQLCAQDNLQVCVPSTPAQIFHLLRRQMKRPYRKPLIVMTPKSLLRNPLATSPLSDLAEGAFQLVIPELDAIDPKAVTKVILCSGKVYYDLLEARREKKRDDIAILRLEQLYPFPEEVLKKTLSVYVGMKELVWCQEEPKNQGSWSMMNPLLHELLTKNQVLRYAGRKPSASPAVGYHAVHETEQKALVEDAIN